MKRDLVGALLWTLAILTAANAVWMLVQPASWYTELPAGVPDFGPYNEHFVRDIACAFAMVAAALGWAAQRPSLRAPLVSLAALFLMAHASLHVFDTYRGVVSADHWWIDFPGVYLPAAITFCLALQAHARRAGPTP